MKRVALLLAILASPVGAQPLTVDSTFDVYSRTAKVRIVSPTIATDHPGLDMYVLAEVVVAPGTDSYTPYDATCRTWIALTQAEPGRYWGTGKQAVSLLVVKPATDGRARRAVPDSVLASPGRSGGSELLIRLGPERQSALGLTAQVHSGPAGAFLLEFPPDLLEAAAAVVARADTALLRATRANQAKVICR